MAKPYTYLMFNGDCRQAFDFYSSALGGKIEFSQTFGDAPEGHATDDTKNMIMHISMDVDGGKIFGSDAPGEHAVTVGNNFSVSLSPTTVDEANKLYAALSEGGTQTMPMQETFWSKGFGMLTDKYKINWMISVADPNAQQG